jgi:hypothetical protein
MGNILAIEETRRMNTSAMTAAASIRRGIGTLVLAMAIPVAFESAALALSLNLTDGSWNGAQGNTSFTTHSSGVDLFATGGVLTINYVGGPSGDNTGSDGVGITDDEIGLSGGERLTVLFPTAVTLERVSITDLFRSEGPLGQHEAGQYSLNGGAYTSFTSNGSDNGALTLNIFKSNVSSIIFRSASNSWSDFSVKGLTYSYSVPEPSSLLLLGAGFLIAATIFRKKAHNVR